MKAKKRISNRRQAVPERAAELLVNRTMLYEVRDELKSDFKALDHKIDLVHGELMGKFQALGDRVESCFERMMSESHRIRCLVEEQNHKNNVVLDGHAILFERQERVEKKVDELAQSISEIKKTAP